jgi:hypothetical protein
MREIILCTLGMALLSTPVGAQTDIPPELEALMVPRITSRTADKMLADGAPVELMQIEERES